MAGVVAHKCTSNTIEERGDKQSQCELCAIVQKIRNKRELYLAATGEIGNVSNVKTTPAVVSTARAIENRFPQSSSTVPDGETV
jgi:hypothetical protein